MSMTTQTYTKEISSSRLCLCCHWHFKVILDSHQKPITCTISRARNNQTKLISLFYCNEFSWYLEIINKSRVSHLSSTHAISPYTYEQSIMITRQVLFSIYMSYGSSILSLDKRESRLNYPLLSLYTWTTIYETRERGSCLSLNIRREFA